MAKVLGFDDDDEHNVELGSLRDSDDWADIEPISQDDGPSAVVPINYDEKYIEYMDYFRAIVQKDEHSERALRLTTGIIRKNASHYTVWHFRRLCLFDLNKDLKDELEFCIIVAAQNAKNYQLWHHRRLLLAKLDEPNDELLYLNDMLSLDSKNYHVWAHRQWFLQHFKCWDGELLYINKLLDEDVRNNSAWNHRHFVVAHGSEAGFSADVIDAEIDYTLKRVGVAVNNESPWNYLRGITQKAAFCREQRLAAFARECIDANPTAVQPHAFLVEVYELLDERQQAQQICMRLADELDTVRRKYWQYRASQLTAPPSSSSSS